MNAPKLLPWIAHKTGLDETLALKLWRRAAGESEELHANCESADYYSTAMSRFIDLAENESNKLSAMPTRIGTDTDWIWRHHKRMAILNKLATQNLAQLWQASQRCFLAGGTKALQTETTH